jgi:hypothetical protein
MPKYDISGTFIGKSFTVRGVEAKDIDEAKKKVGELVKFENATYSKVNAKVSDTFITDFFKGFGNNKG